MNKEAEDWCLWRVSAYEGGDYDTNDLRAAMQFAYSDAAKVCRAPVKFAGGPSEAKEQSWRECAEAIERRAK